MAWYECLYGGSGNTTPYNLLCTAVGAYRYNSSAAAGTLGLNLYDFDTNDMYFSRLNTQKDIVFNDYTFTVNNYNNAPKFKCPYNGVIYYQEISQNGEYTSLGSTVNYSANSEWTMPYNTGKTVAMLFKKS